MKKVKKISKEFKLAAEVVALKEINKKLVYDANRFNTLLEMIRKVLEGGRHCDRLSFEELPNEIMKIKAFKDFTEGARYLHADVVENQRETIRWLINPHTADNSKELENLRKQFGPNRNGLGM